MSEVGETLTIELILEMLQGQSIIEDVGVSDLGSCLTNLLEAVGGCQSRFDFNFARLLRLMTYLLVVGTAAARAANAATEYAAFIASAGICFLSYGKLLWCRNETRQGD